MPDERFEDHLRHPRNRGFEPVGASVGLAGGAACGDLVRFALTVDGDRIAEAGFEVSGCGATIAAASAAVELAEGTPVLEAARLNSAAIAAELGGLSAGKLHAADLASDALHRALGDAVRHHAAVAPAADRTLVAMSGGVDSAVAALRCADGGDVVAVTLELWADPDNDGERSCCSAAAVRGARALAHRLGLPHFTLDLRPEFRAGVVDPWLAGHAAGETPNPCVTCNGHVRIDEMVAFADRVGAATLATGHYARLRDGRLHRAADPDKDQTYMLAALREDTRARLRFPLGELTKPQVRALAADAGLPVAAKPDSQDLCFLAGTGRSAFLARHGALVERPGDILDASGSTLGRHPGAHLFTVGQRRGIGVAAAEPLYVLSTDVRANTITIGPRSALETHDVTVRAVRVDGVPDHVLLRYHSRAVPCRLEGNRIHLSEPVDGAAPGQTAVFLDGDAVVGCATIAR